jgi:hypothetical protein
LLLHLEPETAGSFSLLMLKHDPTDDSGSSWFDGDLLAAREFDNPMSALPDYQFVGTITVLAIPEPTGMVLLLLGGLLFLAVCSARGFR